MRVIPSVSAPFTGGLVTATTAVHKSPSLNHARTTEQTKQPDHIRPSAEIIQHAIEQLALCISKLGQTSQEAAVLVIETVLNINDVFAWLPMVTSSNDEAQQQQPDDHDEIARIFINLCKLRHAQFRGLALSDVSFENLCPNDIYAYVFRYNRLPSGSKISSIGLTKVEVELRQIIDTHKDFAVCLPPL